MRTLRPARFSAVLTALLLPALGGCSGASDDGTLEIAVVPKGTTNEYWKALHAGAEAAAQELGVRIVWKGPLQENDREAQQKVVEDLVVRGVDGLVLVPLDSKALVPPVKEADGRGIPVVVADSDLEWDGRASYVATDNRRGGELAAEALADMLGGQGKIIVLRHMEGSASTHAREEGFLAKIAGSSGIEVLSSNQYAGPQPEGAYQAAENLLNSFAEVDGVFCPSEPSVFGMLRALQDAGRADDLHFVGFDSNEKLVEALRKGEIDALVLQSPVRMGELAVRACVEAARGGTPDKIIDTGVTVVRSAEVDDPAVQALLRPDLSILGQ